jgi:hypothetical protein
MQYDVFEHPSRPNQNIENNPMQSSFAIGIVAYFTFRGRGNEIVELTMSLRDGHQNPDPALRSRSLKHIVFIAGLRWADGERRWLDL